MILGGRRNIDAKKKKIQDPKQSMWDTFNLKCPQLAIGLKVYLSSMILSFG
jgi:hypothetical protein